jgi:5'(3')-deoxyribonucleotidase
MKSLRIGIDIDEVLAPFLPTMKKWRPPKVRVPDRHKYIYRDIYKISEHDSVNMVRDFYQSSEFQNMPPILDSLEAMKELKKNNTLFVITGRQEVVREKTELWIHSNFPGIFTDVILTNSFTRNEVPKVDVCKMLNIGFMIDDNFAVCEDCMDEKIAAANFIGDPVYPWCQESTISVQSWKSVRDILRGNQEIF